METKQVKFTEVSVSAGYTINMGDYDSKRVDCRVTAEVLPGWNVDDVHDALTIKVAALIEAQSKALEVSTDEEVLGD